MEKLEFFHNGTKIFDNLAAENCLCSSNGALHTWQKLFEYSFGTPVEHKLDCQILCLSIARHTAEVFISQASECNTVCVEVFALLNFLTSNDIWEIFVQHFQNVKDLHLQWIFMKSMCSILYSSSIGLFKTRVNKLLQVLKATLLNEDNLPILELFSSLVHYNSKYSCSTKYSCQRGRTCSITPYKEMQNFLYDEMSLDWNSFLMQFHAEISCPVECREKITAEFLFLWNTLSSKNLTGMSMSRFYNQDVIPMFFTSLHNLPLTSLRIYADIILRMFNLDLQNTFKYKWDASVMAKIINFEKNLLILQSPSCEASNSTGVDYSKRLLCELPENDVKWDNIFIRKVFCIYFRVLAELKDESLICEVLPKLMSCMKGLVITSSNGSVILKYFIEDDELLFHVMLSILRIYIVIKKIRTKDVELLTVLEKEANPHYMFVELLQNLGFDHNELVSFLTSDETCFLLYLLQYLKLVINEWHFFVRAHKLLLQGERKRRENDQKIKHTLHSDTIDECVESSEVLESLKEIPHLVPYADSSEDESESLDESEPEKLDECVENSVLVLIHLKVALQRLTEINEFPYNVSPLISLLQECESRWLLKN